MQKPLRRLYCLKIVPKLLSKDKRTNFIGRLLPGKYTGLERVNVFSPPLSNGLQIEVVFNCIYWGCIVTSRVGSITVAFIMPYIWYKTRVHKTLLYIWNLLKMIS